MVTLQNLDSRVKALESLNVKPQLDRIENALNTVSNLLNARLSHATSLTVFDALEEMKEQLNKIEAKLP